MTAIKEKINFIIKEKIHFGNIVDIFNNLIFMHVLYNFMLTAYYITYQNNKSDFQPFLYLSIVLLCAAVIVFEVLFTEMWKLFVAEAVSVMVLAIFFPINGTKICFYAACALMCAKSLWRHHFSYSQSSAYSERFRSVNRSWIMTAVMIFLFAIHMWTLDSFYAETASSALCNGCMLSSFALFIVFSIMRKYAFKFYEYFRQNSMEEGSKQNQLKHSFLVIFIVSLFLVGFIFFVFGGLIIPPVEAVYNIILKAFLWIVLSIFGIDLRSKHKINSRVYGSGKGMPLNNVKNDSFLGSLIPVLVVFIIIAAVIYLVWKIYRNILANYRVGTDEAEFIPISEENSSYENIKTGRGKVLFGKTNNDRVRKYYYQVISKKRKKHNVSISASNTPKEISSMLVHNEKDKRLINNMTDIYEKARYGNTASSDEDVEKMKKIHSEL